MSSITEAPVPDEGPALRHRQWEKDLRRRYGITAAEYNQMLEEQGGVCALCFAPPKNLRLPVDHCHVTGVVRGLLCVRCNVALGALGDDRAGLLRALKYLDRAA